MREKQLKEFLRGELNSIAEGDVNSQSINEIVNSLWEKSGGNFLVCERLINDLPENISKTKKFRQGGLVFLGKLRGSDSKMVSIKKETNSRSRLRSSTNKGGQKAHSEVLAKQGQQQAQKADPNFLKSPFQMNNMQKGSVILGALALGAAVVIANEKNVTMACNLKQGNATSYVAKLEDSVLKNAKILDFHDGVWSEWCSGSDVQLIWDGKQAICDWIPSKREICTPVKSETGGRYAAAFQSCVVRPKPVNFMLDFHTKKFILWDQGKTAVLPCEEFKD